MNTAQQKFEISIHTARIDDRLVLVWPLLLHNGILGARTLKNLGEPHSQYCQTLVDPQCNYQVVLARCWSHICHHGSVDAVRLNNVPAGGALGEFLNLNATRSNIPNETSIMDFQGFPNWDAYNSSLKSTLRRGRTKRRNKLARMGDVSFNAVWPDAPGFEDSVRRVIEFKRDWVAKTGRVGKGMAWDDLDIFLSGFSGTASAMQGLVLHALCLNGKEIAIELGFIRDKHYYCYLGGFDWSYSDFSPGKIQIESSLKWFIENGIDCYDFLPNPAPYKSGWTNKTFEVADYTHPLTLRGQMIERLAGQQVRNRLKKTYYQLPRPVRDLTKRFM